MSGNIVRSLDAANRGETERDIKERMLDVALSVFAKNGFEAASLRQIASQLGIAHGVLRYHFRDKETLWKAAVLHMFQRLPDALPEYVSDYSDPEAHARELVRQYVLYCARHPENMQIMAQETIADSDRLQWMLENFVIPNRRFMEPQIQSLIDQGLLPKLPADRLLFIIAAACQSIFLLSAQMKHMFGKDVTDPQTIDDHIDAITEIFLRNPSP